MRKNKIVFILVICLFTLICGCSKEKVNSDNGNSTHIVSKLKNQGDMTEDKKETKNIVLDIPSTADFLYSCNTIKELKEHADLIVKATVKEEHAWVDGVATIGTEYVLEINKCYFGFFFFFFFSYVRLMNTCCKLKSESLPVSSQFLF